MIACKMILPPIKSSSCVSRYEGPLDKKENASIKETLDLVTQLTLCGETELSVSRNIVYPQLPQFNEKLPQFNEKQPLSSGK